MTVVTTSQPKRRPRRIAADEAHAWARNLRLGNPYAKLVLSMLTLYVNPDGTCFVGIETLADDCELSPDTVRKRLAWLEQVSAIARFPQWLDANGRRNGEGRGKRTSDEIRLLINADPDEIEARAKGNGDGGYDASGAEISPSPQQGQQSENETVSPPVALCQPSDSGEGLTSEPEPKKDSPPYPPLGGEPQRVDEAESEASKSGRGHDTWPDFERAWSEPILRQSIARQVWSALTDDEWKLAIKAAKGYVLHRKSQKKPPNVINAHTFLRERDAWVGFAALVPADPPKPKPVTVLPVGSDEFAALALCFAIARRLPLRPVYGGAKFTGDVPAGSYGLAALVHFKPDIFEVDQSRWTLAAKGSPRFVAWSERVKEWLGAWPEDYRYWLDANDNIVPSREMADGYAESRLPVMSPAYRFPKCCDGLLLPPLEFPPAKGMGHTTTGPPNTLSREDAEEFIRSS